MLFLHKPGSNAYAPTAYVVDSAPSEEESGNPHVVVAGGLLTMIPIDPAVNVMITTNDEILGFSTDIRIHLDLSDVVWTSAYTDCYIVTPTGYIDIWGEPETEPTTQYAGGGASSIVAFDPSITWYRVVSAANGVPTFYTSTDGSSWDTVLTAELEIGYSPGPFFVYVESDDFTQQFVISEVSIVDTSDDSVVLQDTFSGTSLDLDKWTVS